jgi:hypothetical protein
MSVSDGDRGSVAPGDDRESFADGGQTPSAALIWGVAVVVLIVMILLLYVILRDVFKLLPT